MVNILNPETRGEGRRIAIVAARFTPKITQLLVDNTIATLEALGVRSGDISLAWVPGSFDLPVVCDAFAASGKCDGVIALGCVVRGETSHYDYVCRGAADGIMQTSLLHGIPVMFGVLTTENREQAIARADGTKGDKGADCARGVLDMIGVIEDIEDDLPEGL